MLGIEKARWFVCIGVMVAFAGLGVAAPAGAVTVSAHAGASPADPPVFEVKDDSAEDNELTIGVAAVTPTAVQLDVYDRKAPLVVGSGCVGAGTPVSPATCTLPKAASVAGANLIVDLGGGKNFLDASNLILHPELPIAYTGGPGQDVVVSGGGDDVIDPGAGENAAYGNPGDDEILAPALPDAGDVYGGGEGVDRVNYARRSLPVHLQGLNVQASEGNDQLMAIEIVRGGEGGDILVEERPANPFMPTYTRIEGGPGNDQLIGGTSGPYLLGGPGNDSLIAGDAPPIVYGAKGPPPKPLPNHLIGEGGRDTYVGGTAVDLIEEYENEGDAPDPATAAAWIDADDIAYGNDGNDRIELGAGADTVYGGPGKDWLNGGLGADLVAGGPDNDVVVGDKGSDRLFGGAGDDRLFSARAVAYGAAHPLTAGPADGTDEVGCGSGRDRAYVNPWDSRQHCEVVRVFPSRR